ncbi:MAG TPA: FixH family protein [Virgibacillus sp.]|nr:FixH family protein [Virgibacillus sp.]
MKSKRSVIAILLMSFLFVACSPVKVDLSLEKAPRYKDGESYPMVIKAMEGKEGVTGLHIMATLEMAKMDHGVIEINFTDNGDGTYSGEVELPMEGEWIGDFRIDENGEIYETTIQFDVKGG